MIFQIRGVFYQPHESGQVPLLMFSTVNPDSPYALPILWRLRGVRGCITAWGPSRITKTRPYRAKLS
jgi:hypothetical protein